MGQTLHQKSSRATAKYGNQTEIRVCSTSKDKWTSRESQWLNMQWDKKEAISTPGESQTLLGRRATLRALESQNYTQCGYPRNPLFLVQCAEAVLPVEITHEAPRIASYNETTSTEGLQADVNALDKARDVALARATQY
jgi:hypothetical protein